MRAPGAFRCFFATLAVLAAPAISCAADERSGDERSEPTVVDPSLAIVLLPLGAGAAVEIVTSGLEEVCSDAGYGIMRPAPGVERPGADADTREIVEFGRRQGAGLVVSVQMREVGPEIEIAVRVISTYGGRSLRSLRMATAASAAAQARSELRELLPPAPASKKLVVALPAEQPLESTKRAAEPVPSAHGDAPIPDSPYDEPIRAGRAPPPPVGPPPRPESAVVPAPPIGIGRIITSGGAAFGVQVGTGLITALVWGLYALDGDPWPALDTFYGYSVVAPAISGTVAWAVARRSRNYRISYAAMLGGSYIGSLVGAVAITLGREYGRWRTFEERFRWYAAVVGLPAVGSAAAYGIWREPLVEPSGTDEGELVAARRSPVDWSPPGPTLIAPMEGGPPLAGLRLGAVIF
ncbi:MAG: hypothetical protein R6V85_14535 [Polyangia bacterium]